MDFSCQSYSSISEEEYLAQYSILNYPTYAVTADNVIFSLKSEEETNYRKDPERMLAVLLIHRKAHPDRGLLALPGGFLNPGETLEECSRREVTEETGITPEYLVPSGVFSRVDRDPRGRILSNVFLSVYPKTDSPASAEKSHAYNAGWYTVTLRPENGAYRLTLKRDQEEAEALLSCTESSGYPRFRTIENTGLAFDHGEMIASALLDLRKSVLDYHLLFHFLPEEFTMSELQRIYEIITDERVLPANFRRKIAEHVQETDKFIKGSGHRPARLYRRAGP